MSRDSEYEAIVIGGGPAGATAAAVLALHGRRVLVLEKERFPRFRVGESLMPYCYFPLERSGALERVKATQTGRKYSVQFISTGGRRSEPFYFFQHLEHEASTTWQVWRGEFDQILLENAAERGAEVRQETRVTEVLQENGRCVGVRATGPDGPYEVRAPITLDASGRDALTLARRGWRVPDAALKKIAIWAYFRGGRRDAGLDEYATTIAYLPQKGWFWYIPLPGDQVGVGVVAEKDYLFDEGRDLETVFRREVAKNPWVAHRMETAELESRWYATSEFSYRSRYCAADGLVLVGDAFCFLDPVFASGVFLALKSGELAADAAHAALAAGDTAAARFAGYGEQMRGMIEVMRKMVYAFYDHEFNFRSLVQAHPEVKPVLTDALIGHLSRDFTELFRAMGTMAPLPDPLPHGGPLLPEPCASSN